MFDFRDELRELVKRAREIHDQEKGLLLESYKIIGYLESRNAAVNLGLSKEEFAASLGLSISVYWKRAQAGRIIRRFAKVESMIKKDELQISHVNIIAPMITPANEEVLLASIKNQPKRAVQLAAASITKSGERIEIEIELRLKFKKSQLEVLDRAMEVLAASGKQPSQVETLVTALSDLLTKRDPMEKAKRAEKRRTRKEEVSPDDLADLDQHRAPNLSQQQSNDTQSPPDLYQGGESTRQRYVPRAIRHNVFLRDGGQCSYISSTGQRCTERGMLELDHKIMWCRGGEHSLENLTLRCRYHNQGLAKLALGRDHLAPLDKRLPRSSAFS